MKNKKIVAVAVFFVLAIFFGYLVVKDLFLSKGDFTKEKNIYHPEKISEDDILEVESMQKDVEKMEKEIAKLQEDFLEKDIKKQNTRIYNNFFNEIDIDEVDSLKKKDDVEPVAAISFDSSIVSVIQSGDKFELPMFGNSIYQVQVDKKIKNKSGSITITGNLVDFKDYSFILTKGKERTFMSVTTPDGAYEIEIKNGKGFVYDAKEIEKKRVDYSKPDVIVPKHE